MLTTNLSILLGIRIFSNPIQPITLARFPSSHQRMTAEQRRLHSLSTQEAKLTNQTHPNETMHLLFLFYFFWPSSTAARTADCDMLGPTANDSVQHGNTIPCSST